MKQEPRDFSRGRFRRAMMITFPLTWMQIQ
ncbi:hypothetical protein HNR32_001324 [Pectinatus brassicae]|uniref:Uncharacterized protein n=1 Tax=Pectinatus brassicae TaxID=862415 RepID=A0A840UGD3_9FIRM|nr:hypothetical protein [Pectinatus brassicae]